MINTQSILVNYLQDTLFGPLARQSVCELGMLEGPSAERLCIYVAGPDTPAIGKAHSVSFEWDQQHYYGVVQQCRVMGEGLALDLERG